MKDKIIILENGTREEACLKFDEAKDSISDFKTESVSLFGNIRSSHEGWSVVKYSK